MKRIYTVEVNFRTIKVPKPSIIIPSGNVGADFIKFVDLGNDWDSLIKTAVFISNNCAETVLLDDNNCAEIPGSVLKEKGLFSFGLWGTQLTDSDEIEFRYSTNLQTGIVGDGAYDENAVSMQERQAGVYERVLNYINKHIQDNQNPHNVTAELTGAYTKETVDELVREVNSLLKTHKVDYNNPHCVTAEQIGTYDKDTIDMYRYNDRGYVDGKVGDIETALDGIKTLQQTYIDGGAE